MHRMQSDGWAYSKGCTSQKLGGCQGPRSLAPRITILSQHQFFPDANTASTEIGSATAKKKPHQPVNEIFEAEDRPFSRVHGIRLDEDVTFAFAWIKAVLQNVALCMVRVASEAT